ncbi:hypothetical protein L9F63_027178, partial [Diploptera punctata]
HIHTPMDLFDGFVCPCPGFANMYNSLQKSVPFIMASICEVMRAHLLIVLQSEATDFTLVTRERITKFCKNEEKLKIDEFLDLANSGLLNGEGKLAPGEHRQPPSPPSVKHAHKYRNSQKTHFNIPPHP